MFNTNFRKVFLPYCVQKQENGLYAVLNRSYKPVGMMVEGFVKYEDHPCLVSFKGLTEKKAQLISHNDDEDLDCIFLYDDACAPSSKKDWDAYSERLEILSKLSITG